MPQNRSQYMAQVLRKYPDWKDDEHLVRLKASGLKALLRQAFDRGYVKGRNPRNLTGTGGANELLEYLSGQ